MTIVIVITINISCLQLAATASDQVMIVIVITINISCLQLADCQRPGDDSNSNNNKHQLSAASDQVTIVIVITINISCLQPAATASDQVTIVIVITINKLSAASDHEDSNSNNNKHQLSAVIASDQVTIVIVITINISCLQLATR